MAGYISGLDSMELARESARNNCRPAWAVGVQDPDEVHHEECRNGLLRLGTPMKETPETLLSYAVELQEKTMISMPAAIKSPRSGIPAR